MRNPAPALGLAALALAAGAADARSKPHAADLGGLWTNLTATPLERPPVFDGPTTTPAKAAAFERTVGADYVEDDDAVGGRHSEWFEFGPRLTRLAGQIRTSIISDPADGRLPLSPAGRAAVAAAVRDRVSRVDDPETRPATERCLMGGAGSSGAPLLPNSANSNYQIVQTPGYVVIRTESSIGARIIRLNARDHLPAAIRPWAGDSIGRWEGRTLVVETTNFNPGEGFKSPRALYISPAAKVTERFTRISASEILYAFTVDDPQAFDRPWSGEQVLQPAKAIYEYACHEGNYSLPGALAGGRHEEQAATK